MHKKEHHVSFTFDKLVFIYAFTRQPGTFHLEDEGDQSLSCLGIGFEFSLVKPVTEDQESD